MPANQHDGMQSSATQWENISLVLEQNDAFLGEPLRHNVTAFYIWDLLDHRVIKQAGSKNRAQDTMDVVVDLILGNLPALDSFLQRIAKEVLARLFLVKTCM
jgi:hypothetical protein